MNATGTRTACRNVELIDGNGWQPEIEAGGKQPVICGRSVPHELTMADLRSAPPLGRRRAPLAPHVSAATSAWRRVRRAVTGRLQET